MLQGTPPGQIVSVKAERIYSWPKDGKSSLGYPGVPGLDSLDFIPDTDTTKMEELGKFFHRNDGNDNPPRSYRFNFCVVT
eukprot:1176886-Prorocentrum_minimum.AAC.2